MKALSTFIALFVLSMLAGPASAQQGFLELCRQGSNGSFQLGASRGLAISEVCLNQESKLLEIKLTLPFGSAAIAHDIFRLETAFFKATNGVTHISAKYRQSKNYGAEVYFCMDPITIKEANDSYLRIGDLIEFFDGNKKRQALKSCS